MSVARAESKADASSETTSESMSPGETTRRNDSSSTASIQGQGLLYRGGPAVGLRSRRSAEGGPDIQAKLTVSEPGDKYEKEAERVADAVMRMSDPEAGPKVGEEAPIGQIQRMCPRCRRRHRQSKPLNCEECEVELRRREDSDGGDARMADSVQQAADMAVEPGKPLPERTRSFFESRMDADFSNVRIHTGGEADRAARAINARAYTLGSDIAFRAGEFQPGTASGSRLLAHELSHVVQQAETDTPQIARQDAGATDAGSRTRDAGRAPLPAGSGSSLAESGSKRRPGAKTAGRIRTFGSWVVDELGNVAWNVKDLYQETYPATIHLSVLFDSIKRANRAASTRVSVPDKWRRRVREYINDSRWNSRPSGAASILYDALDTWVYMYKNTFLLNNVVQGAGAMTLENDILWNEQPNLKTYVHELVHVNQYNEYGELPFLAAYFVGQPVEITLRKMITGQTLDYYTDNAFEVQAEEIENDYDAWHKNKYGKPASGVTP